jgi:hypothetical protein
MGNRKNLPHHEELTRQPVMTKNQFTEKKLLRPLHYGYTLLFNDCTHKVTIVGAHGTFPAFDLILNGTAKVDYRAPGTGPLNLYDPWMFVYLADQDF